MCLRSCQRSTSFPGAHVACAFPLLRIRTMLLLIPLFFCGHACAFQQLQLSLLMTGSLVRPSSYHLVMQQAKPGEVGCSGC